MYVIGTAGHVDHGKSLLVEALTGIDPDRLREEKVRGMTIDLGFAWLTLPSGRTVSIVDVPGHERFIKNMLAGAGGIDLALLVVAADDGVMPQTREHLAILDLLDVRHGIVALTKRDLVDDAWLELIAADIVETLAGTSLEGSPVLACSAVTRDGLDALLAALDAAIDALAPKRDLARPRLPIDRVFSIGGFGTVVTGTLIDGALGMGDELELVPGGGRARVRGLQSHRDSVERALPGTRTAVNLTGIAKEELRRGAVLARPGTLSPTTVLDARLRAVRGRRRALRHNMPLTFHCFADESNATLRLLDADELRPGEEAWGQIKLETPVAILRGDRFVLRTPDDTVAGGVVADVSPRRHRRHDPRVVAALEAMLSPSAADMVRDAVARRPWLSRANLIAALPLPPHDVGDAIEALVASREAIGVYAGGEALVVMAAEHAALARRAREAVASFHATHPLRAGMPQEQLRAALGVGSEIFAAVAESWPDVTVAGGLARAAGFAPTPSPEQGQQIDAFLAALAPAKGAAKSPAPLPPELLAYAVETGSVVSCGEGVVFRRDVFDEMTERVRERIVENGTITLAEARDIIGTGRKQAQAFLEELDRRRITRRTGDTRVLR